MRLLETVDNGRGTVVTFKYTSSSNAAFVTAEPGYRTPGPTQVVHDISVADSASGTRAVTTYRYTNPVSNRARFGHFGFRGFESVEITGPANARGARARTIERYAYLWQSGAQDRRRPNL